MKRMMNNLLIPEEVLRKPHKMHVLDLAEYLDVPEPMVTLRLTEFATDRELARWQYLFRNSINAKSG